MLYHPEYASNAQPVPLSIPIAEGGEYLLTATAEEDGRSLGPRQPRPVGVRVACGGDRLVDVLGAALGDVGEDVLLPVRHHRFEGDAGLDVLAADDQRDLRALLLHPPDAVAQLLALARAGCVRLDRLVRGRRRPEDAGGGHVRRL